MFAMPVNCHLNGAVSITKIDNIVSEMYTINSNNFNTLFSENIDQRRWYKFVFYVKRF